MPSIPLTLRVVILTRTHPVNNQFRRLLLAWARVRTEWSPLCSVARRRGPVALRSAGPGLLLILFRLIGLGVSLRGAPRPRSLPPRPGGHCRTRPVQSRNHWYASLRQRRIGAVRTEAPSLSAPSHDQEARDYRLRPQMSFTPSSTRHVDAHGGVRSIRTDRQAHRPRAQSLPPAPSPPPSGPLHRPQSTQLQANRMGGCGRHRCGGREDSRSRASRGRTNSRPRS